MQSDLGITKKSTKKNEFPRKETQMTDTNSTSREVIRQLPIAALLSAIVLGPMFAIATYFSYFA